MTVGTMAAAAWSLLVLLTLSPRILPARAVVRDRPATVAPAVVVRVWRRTPRRQPTSRLHRLLHRQS